MASEAPMSRAPALLGALGDTPELNEMGSGVCVYERWTYTAHSSVLGPRTLEMCGWRGDTTHGV